MPRLILASTSRYRHMLLSRLGIPFEAMNPEVDETPLPGEDPVQLALRLARLKAQAIWNQHPGSVVIGSDQVAVCQGTVLGKPGCRERAIAQLTLMQNKELVFTTALCVINAQGHASVVPSQTVVKLRPLSQATIEAYVDKEQPFDCAGAAKIEALGIALMEKVESDDPTSLIGLPLMKVTTLLKEAGVEVLPGL